MADTELQQLVVWVGTTEKIEEARAQGLITENDFAITTDAPEFQTKLTSANAGTGISITEVGGVVKISNTQTSAEWGNILGNLPDQADLWNYLSDILGDISDIQSLIPAQASSSNQLADKAFVNSTVQTATANFRGNWEDWADVPVNAEDYPLDFAQSRTPTVNDYLVVRDASDYALETLEGTWRFKYSGEWSINGKNGWHPEYQVNETPLTASQLAALNSGATEAKINQITTNQNAIGTLANLTTTEKNNLVGAVNELDSSKQDNISDLDTIRVGATAGASAIQGISLGGTSQTPDANKNVNIPLATNSYVGVCRGSTPNGVVASSGVLSTVAASDAELQAKTQAHHPVVPSHLDVAIREGLGNNSLTWTEAYKTSARNTIGAEAQATIQTLSATDSITLADNTIYNGGEQTALTIALPATVNVSFLCEICFSSGSTATTITYPQSDINWIGDDVSANVFTPIASKRYTIICSYDGSNYLFVVKGV